MYPYRLLRSDRKTLSLSVEEDLTVLVRAPRRLSLRQIEAFVSAHEGWIRDHMAKVRARNEAHPEPDEARQAALLAAAKAILPGKVAFYARKMGVSPTGLTITGARTRFGSCSAKDRLSFSWRLMDYPEAAIDYVVVHELAHIRHKDHSPRFHAFVASILPDHLERRRLLRL